MKRFLSLLLVLALLLSACPFALAASGSGFTDVKESDYFYDAVCWAVENGITTGVSSSSFGASVSVSRAQAVTFLWRLAGSPAPETSFGFADVPDGTWFSDAVNWAAENGIVNGRSANSFAPMDACTREQAAAFLYRYEKLLGGGFEGLWSYQLDFTDVDKISAYAFEALCWMNMQGIMQGSHGRLDPKGLCSRAQFVSMLYRFAAGESAQPTETPDIPDTPTEVTYTDKSLPVLRESLESTETVLLRYYSDMPNVPYMKLTDFYNQFYLVGTPLTEGMTAARSGSKTVYTNYGGYTLTADPDADILYCEDIVYFAYGAYVYYVSPDGESLNYYPYVNMDGYAFEPENPLPNTLRLCDYGIDLRMSGDGLYFPLGTLSDLFAGSDCYYVVYNGEKVYVTDDFYMFHSENAIYADEHLSDPLHEDRSADMAAFAYHELCFSIDTFYGRPGSEYIHNALENASLDAILTEQYPAIKKLLLSADPEEYISGVFCLVPGLLSDGGHTWILSTFAFNEFDLTQEAWDLLLSSPIFINYHTFVESLDLRDLLDAKRAPLYGDDYYVEQGDTAMIRFDEFINDYSGWTDYYAGESGLPDSTDTLSLIYAGLMRAAENPEIKNVVLDISCNSGGEVQVMHAIEWLLTGDAYEITENRIAQQTVTEFYTLDANFDGVFDEQDHPFSQFRYGILTSGFSFSCANTFPFFMKDHGSMILGMQSGGGTCVVRYFSTADGLQIISSYAGNCMRNAALESMDNGCPVDIDLRVEGDDPYASFYDLSRISEAMNAFYDGAEDVAA